MKMSMKLSVVLALAWALLLLAGWIFISRAGVEASPPANDPILEFDMTTIRLDGDDVHNTDPRGIAVVPETNKIYVANYLSDTVSIIDGDTLTVTGVISGLSRPCSIAYNPNSGYLYVSNHGDDKIRLIDTTTNQVVSPTISVGDRPRGVAFNSNDGYIYVANFDGWSISVINGTEKIEQFDVGASPAHIAVNATANKVYVTLYNDVSRPVAIISSTGVLTRVENVHQRPWGIAADPNTGLVYVADVDAGELVIINTNDVVSGSIKPPVPASLRMVAIDPEAHLVFVTEDEPDDGPDPDAERVFVFNTETMTFSTDSIPVEQDPDRGIAYDLDRRCLYVSNRRSDSVSVICDIKISYKLFLPIIMKNYP